MMRDEAIFPDMKDKVFISPTDTIIGLGCLANSPNAVERIYEIKERPKTKPFILLVDDFRRLEKMVEVTPFVRSLLINAAKPTTVIYDKILDVPPYLLSEDGTVGIRIAIGGITSSIVAYFDSPVVSTSANFSGAPTAYDFSNIDAKLLEQVDYVFPQSHAFVPSSDPSAILKVVGNKVKIIRA